MPTGLDGNPDPASSARRAEVLERLADEVVVRRNRAVLRVAVDGIDGAGKTTLADELATVLRSRGVAVIRSTTDSFHNPRRVRWRKGPLSPEGFYRDSHNLELLEVLLLQPLSADPPRPFRAAAFDEPSDSPLEAPIEQPDPGAVLLFDGLFLARPELRGYWDYFVFVDGAARVTEARIARASADCPPGLGAVWHFAVWCARLDRYVGGMRLYIAECEPESRADAVVDNNDLLNPHLRLQSAR